MGSAQTKEIKITVLMAVYNGADHLEESVNSILEQSFPDFEFLIIDDGSTDNTAEILKKFSDPRIKIIQNKKNIGLTKSLNLGLEEARGKYIARMDADDISLTKRLQVQYDFMEKNKNVVVCGTWVELFGDSESKIMRTKQYDKEIRALLMFHNAINHPSVMIRKDILDSQNLKYDEKFKSTQDYDLWTRIPKDLELANIQEVLVQRRVHKKSVGVAKKTQQLAYANEIRVEQLKKIKLVANKKELKIHEAIGTNNFEKSVDFLKDTDQWLKKVAEHNKKHKYFDELSLYKALKTKWINIYNSIPNEHTEKYKVIAESELFGYIGRSKKSEKQNKNPRLTIAVGVYNNDALITKAMQSLEEQTLPESEYEVLVIDNNSSDNSYINAKNYAKGKSNFKVLQEKNQGLSYVRNRGYKEAKGEYVVYMDDDAIASPVWLERIIDYLEEKTPDLLGGPIYPFYINPKPKWFKDSYEIRVHTPESGWLPEGRTLSGSNFIVKKSYLEKIGGFDTSIGMSGGKIAYGEEVKVIKRAEKDEKKIYYAHDLIVTHFVPDFKKHLAYFMFRNYKAGKDAGYIYDEAFGYAERHKLAEYVDEFMNETENSIKNRNMHKYPYPENYLIEEYLPKLHYMGRLTRYMLSDGKINVNEALNYIYPKHHKISIKDYIKSQYKLIKMLLK